MFSIFWIQILLLGVLDLLCQANLILVVKWLELKFVLMYFFVFVKYLCKTYLKFVKWKDLISIVFKLCPLTFTCI